MKQRKIYQESHMVHGGNQLAELIDKAFGLNYIEEHREELGLNEKKMTELKVWIKHEYSTRQTLRELTQLYQTRVKDHVICQFIYGRNSLFSQLLKRLDLRPKFTKSGRLIKMFLFLTYEEYEIEGSDYRVVETKINKEFFWNQKIGYEHRKFEKRYILRYYRGKWVVTKSQFALQYIETLNYVKRIQKQTARMQ